MGKNKIYHLIASLPIWILLGIFLFVVISNEDYEYLFGILLAIFISIFIVGWVVYWINKMSEDKEDE